MRHTLTLRLFLLSAVLLGVTGCTSSSPTCTDQVEPALLESAERAVFALFEDELDRDHAERLSRTYEIRDARLCGETLTFRYWPQVDVVGTGYRMAFDPDCDKVIVTGVD